MLECHSQSGDVKARGSIVFSAVWAPKNSRCTDTLKLFPGCAMFSPFQHFLSQKSEVVRVHGHAHVQGQSRQGAGVRQTELSGSGPWINISFQLHQIFCWFRSVSPGKGEKPKWNQKYDRPWILRERPKLTATFTSSLILIWKQSCNCSAQRHHCVPDSTCALGFTIGKEGLQHILCTLGQDFPAVFGGSELLGGCPSLGKCAVTPHNLLLPFNIPKSLGAKEHSRG